MKFQIYTGSHDQTIIEVVHACLVRDYVLMIKFTDGKNHEVDFKAFLEGSVHPEIRKYLNPILFKTFQIKDGNVVWNDYDLIFPLEDLYLGKIS